MLKTSPLHQIHEAAGARLIDFAGWQMPVMYESIVSEHLAVRERVGMFDISHMGQIFVLGPKAEKWLDEMLTNRVPALDDGQAHYTFLLNEGGGILDDLILYRLEAERFLLLVNASRIFTDSAWLQEHLPKKGVEVIDESDNWGGLAIQGPKACETYRAVTEGRTLPARNSVDTVPHLGSEVLVARTGYTGEDGFELFCPRESITTWWGAFHEAGATPCGLGARDTLRLEMAYPLYGQDLSPDRSPLEAGLGYFTDLTKPPFIGQKALLDQKENGLESKLTALKMRQPGPPPRAGYQVLSENGGTLGTLTSGCQSPSLEIGIALAYLPTAYSEPGQVLNVKIREKTYPAEVVPKPFYQR